MAPASSCWTGVEDVLPEIAGAVERVREGVLRCCPICDAFEVIGLDLAVVGPGRAPLARRSSSVPILGGSMVRLAVHPRSLNRPSDGCGLQA